MQPLAHSNMTFSNLSFEDQSQKAHRPCLHPVAFLFAPPCHHIGEILFWSPAIAVLLPHRTGHVLLDRTFAHHLLGLRFEGKSNYRVSSTISNHERCCEKRKGHPWLGQAFRFCENAVRQDVQCSIIVSKNYSSQTKNAMFLIVHLFEKKQKADEGHKPCVNIFRRMDSRSDSWRHEEPVMGEVYIPTLLGSTAWKPTRPYRTARAEQHFQRHGYPRVYFEQEPRLYSATCSWWAVFLVESGLRQSRRGPDMIMFHCGFWRNSTPCVGE